MPSLPSFPRNCPICDASQHTRIEEYCVTEWPVVSCLCCDFVYLARAIDYSALKQEHAWEKSHKQETRRRRRHLLYRLDQATRFRLVFGARADEQWVMSAVRDPGNVLDIGCSTQCRLGEGVVPYGIEISQELANKADSIYRERGGHVVNAPAVQGLDQFDDGFFSAVIMRSYLEHEAHPRQVIAKVHRKLKPGGFALVKVPDFGCVGRYVMGVKWCGFRFPDHLNYFTEPTLRLLAVANGFRFRRQNLFPRLNDNLYAMLVRVRTRVQALFITHYVAIEGALAL